MELWHEAAWDGSCDPEQVGIFKSIINSQQHFKKYLFTLLYAFCYWFYFQGTDRKPWIEHPCNCWDLVLLSGAVLVQFHVEFVLRTIWQHRL